MEWFSVGIETDGPSLPGDVAVIERLAGALGRMRGITAPVVGWGGLAAGPSVQLSLRARDAADAASRAIEVVEKALTHVQKEIGAVARVDVMTEDYLDRWLAEEPERFVGVAEIAGMLGVTKQRVSELRGTPGFPEPVAELAAGPVWRLSTLKRFVAEWPRKRGRPKKGTRGVRAGGTTEAGRPPTRPPAVASA